MELSDLKSIWNQAQPGSEQELRVDHSFMKKLSLEKTQSSMTYMRVGAIIELVINLAFIIPFMGLAIRLISQPKFALAALLLALMGIATMIWNIYSIYILSTLRYQESITVAQKKLAKLDYQNLYRQRTLLYILFPLSWAAILILFCKLALNLDLYEYPTYLLLNMLGSVLFVPLVIWISKKFPDRKKQEILGFLESIKKFEDEW